MGVMSRRVVPACSSLCYFCPSLRARSRQPVKRYKKIIADIYQLPPDGEPNDRRIGKLCDYVSRNPTRIPKVTEYLEQRFYKDLRHENFTLAKVVPCIYRKLLCSCNELRPLLATSSLSFIRTLLDMKAHDDLQVLGCLMLVDFLNGQVDSTHMFNLEGLIPKLCKIGHELREDDEGLRLRSAALQALASMDIFSAGSETSSTVLVWAMSELVKNPRVMDKARSEVRETFKGQDKITEGDLVKLRYLQLVIKEAMRLHAPVPLLVPRECRETCQVMGYDVPKGTKVLVNVWAISSDNKFWGDGEVFRPERFENSNIDFRGTDYEFTPFGAGRRICPGISLGLANMELALASLLYYFDWDLPDGVMLEELDMTETFGITLRKKSMLLLKAKPHNTFVSQ